MSQVKSYDEYSSVPPEQWGRFLKMANKAFPDLIAPRFDLPSGQIEVRSDADLNLKPLYRTPPSGVIGIGLEVRMASRDFGDVPHPEFGTRLFRAEYDNEGLYVQEALHHTEGSDCLVEWSCETGEFCDDNADASVGVKFTFSDSRLIPIITDAHESMRRGVLDRSLEAFRRYDDSIRADLLRQLASMIEAQLQLLPAPIDYSSPPDLFAHSSDPAPLFQLPLIERADPVMSCQL